MRGTPSRPGTTRVPDQREDKKQKSSLKILLDPPPSFNNNLSLSFLFPFFFSFFLSFIIIPTRSTSELTPQSASVSKCTRATYLRVLTLYVFPTNAFLAGSLVDTYIGPRVCRLTRSVAPPRKPDDTPVTISIHDPPPSPSPPPPDLRHRPARQRQATAP